MPTINFEDLQNATQAEEAVTSGASAKKPFTIRKHKPRTPADDEVRVRQLSVKVDQPEYIRIRRAAVELELAHQDIIGEAIEEWLKKRNF